MLSCVLGTYFDFANRNARHDVYHVQTRVISNKPPHHAFDCWRVHSLLGSHQARREVCKAPLLLHESLSRCHLCHSTARRAVLVHCWHCPTGRTMITASPWSLTVIVSTHLDRLCAVHHGLLRPDLASGQIAQKPDHLEWMEKGIRCPRNPRMFCPIENQRSDSRARQQAVAMF
jgi:hypothetical protein